MPAMTLRSPLVRFGHVPATTPRSHGRKRVHGLPGGGGDGATGRRVSHNQSHSRAALTPAFNRYKSSFSSARSARALASRWTPHSCIIKLETVKLFERRSPRRNQSPKPTHKAVTPS
jgi:hypothetical protein